MTSIKNTARLAGFLILLIAVLSPFSILYLPSTLIVPGDAAATASNVMASARLAMTIVMAVNVFNSFGVLLLLSDAEYLTVFEPDQLHALALLVLNLHESGVYIWQVFFGLHWVAVGYLVAKSGYFPRILGIMLMVTCLGYLMDSFGILFPSSGVLSIVSSAVLAVGVIGELSFTLWLLIEGVNVEQWEIRARKSA